MSYSDEHFFKDELIRDTVEHMSNIGYAGAFIPKTILFNNTLDAAVDIEVFGCSKEEPSKEYQINSVTITIPANTNSFETLDDYFQCFLLKAKAQTVPTTGAFDSSMLMTSGNGK